MRRPPRETLFSRVAYGCNDLTVHLDAQSLDRDWASRGRSSGVCSGRWGIEKPRFRASARPLCLKRTGQTNGLSLLRWLGSAAQFNYPQGAAAQGAGNFHVADGNNHTIRKVTAGDVVTT